MAIEEVLTDKLVLVLIDELALLPVEDGRPDEADFPESEIVVVDGLLEVGNEATDEVVEA